MPPSPLLKKLGLRARQRALLINPPTGYKESLGELPEGVVFTQLPAKENDFVQLFVKDSADEFQALSPKAIQAVIYDGLLWVCYPKKSAKTGSDLSRDSFCSLMQPSGMHAVMQISIDDTWSALRFRPQELVEK
jgi:hypothetical protein